MSQTPKRYHHRTPWLIIGALVVETTVGTGKGFSGREYYGAPGEIRTPGLLVRRERLDAAQVDDFQPKSAREASNISAGYIAVSACLLWAATLGIRREWASITHAAFGSDRRISFRGGDRRLITAPRYAAV